MDYEILIYNQPLNESLSNRIESVQYKAALAITGAIQGSSQKKLYQELGLEHLHQRRWTRWLCLFYRVFLSNVPIYVHSHIPFRRTSTRQPNTFNSFYCRTEHFQNSFSPYVIKEWDKLDPNKQSCQSYKRFRKALLNIIRPSENKIFNIHNQVGLKLLTRLRLGLRHLCEHKCQHNFEDNLHLLCSCSIEAKTTLHFFLRCQFFSDIQEILMNDLMDIDRFLPSLSQDKLIIVLLYGSDAFDYKKNHKILICTIEFIKDSHRFDDPFSKSFLLC